MSKEAISTERALKLALEGAANYIDALGGDSRKYRQALAQQPAQQALDKMAENARQVGLDYEPSSVSKLAREAGIRDCTCNGTLGCLERFAELVRADAIADEREAISDEWSMCVQSDLEHGVKSLNEQAAKDWFKDYREISKFGAWLEARSNT